MLIAQNATIEHLRTLNAEQLRNVWYSAYYHPSRYAKGKGSKKYARALANFASNLSTYLLCNQEMYKRIAEMCADDAIRILNKYIGTPNGGKGAGHEIHKIPTIRNRN